MACYHPIPASQEGQGVVTLWPPMGESNITLPCGHCMGCKTDRATMWANRATHEASQWRNNQFLTLTYDDDNLPPQGHLTPRHLQLLIKRMRKHANRNPSFISRDPRSNLRYLACGEYGEKTQRPHYHALIFNGAFSDTHKVGKDLYESETLNELWPYGQHKIGACTGASAAYIAQYTLKKNAGRYQHPGYMNPETGEYTHKRTKGFYRYDDGRAPQPFLRASQKPAIGAEWLKEYATDLQHGYLVEGTRKHPIPRYYRDQIKEQFPELREQIQLAIEKQRQRPTDRKTSARLADTELIHQRRKQLTEHKKL